MKMRIVLWVLLCVSMAAKGQVRFEKGYFIDNSGKRTECSIENNGWKANPTFITYKVSDASDKSQVTTKFMQEFGIYGCCTYRRFVVNIDRSSNTIGYISNSRLPEYRTETLMLEVLLQGQASLYAHNDGNLTRYFYETPNMPAEQLLMKQYMEGSAINTNMQFRQQLYLHVRCAQTPDNQFARIDYTASDLLAHFKKYNSCFQSESTTQESTNPKSKRNELFALRVMPGVAAVGLDMQDPVRYFDSSTKFNALVFTAALDAEFMLAYNKNSWSLFISPSYYKFSAQKNYTSHITNPGLYNDGQPILYQAKAAYSALDVAMGARCYIHSGTKSKFYLELGYVVSFVSGDPKITITATPEITNTNKTIPLDQKNYFLFGAGYAYDRFNVGLRYGLPRDITDLASWKANFSSIGLQLGYKVL